MRRLPRFSTHRRSKSPDQQTRANCGVLLRLSSYFLSTAVSVAGFGAAAGAIASGLLACEGAVSLCSVGTTFGASVIGLLLFCLNDPGVGRRGDIAVSLRDGLDIFLKLDLCCPKQNNGVMFR